MEIEGYYLMMGLEDECCRAEEKETELKTGRRWNRIRACYSRRNSCGTTGQVEEEGHASLFSTSI